MYFIFSTAESIQLCYTSHFVIIVVVVVVVVVVGSSIDIDVVNNCVILSHDICGFSLQSPLPHNTMIWCVAISVNDSKGESSPLAQ